MNNQPLAIINSINESNLSLNINSQTIQVHYLHLPHSVYFRQLSISISFSYSVSLPTSISFPTYNIQVLESMKVPQDDDYKMSEIIRSYRSDESSDEDLPQKSPQNTSPSPVPGDSFQFQIRDSVYVGDQRKKLIPYKPNPPSRQEKSDWPKQSFDIMASQDLSNDSFDDNSFIDTDEIVTDTKQRPNISKPSPVQAASKANRAQLDHHLDDISSITSFMQQKPKPQEAAKRPNKHKTPVKNPVMPEDLEVIDIGISMITYRDQSKTGPENKPINPDKGAKKTERYTNPSDEIGRSVHIAGPNSIQSQPREVKFSIIDRRMYWLYLQTQLQVTFECTQLMVEQFLKKDILLPQIENSQFESEFVAELMSAYTAFLNSVYFKEFSSALAQISTALSKSIEGYKGKGFTKTSSLSSPKSAIPQLSLKNVFSFLQNKKYSKVTFLIDHLLNKLAILRIGSQFVEPKLYEKSEGAVRGSIGLLMFLVCFENAEAYCQEKSSDKIEQMRWKKILNGVLQNKKQWFSLLKQGSTGLSIECEV